MQNDHRAGGVINTLCSALICTLTTFLLEKEHPNLTLITRPSCLLSLIKSAALYRALTKQRGFYPEDPLEYNKRVWEPSLIFVRYTRR